MKQYLFILLVLSITFYSCSKNDNYEESLSNSAVEASEQLTKQDRSSSDMSGKIDQQKSKRKIIKEGNISFRSSDIKATRTNIDKAIAKYDAYISKENEYSYNNRIEENIIIRVPSESFDSLLNDITNGVNKLDSKNIEVKDVTSKYIDVKSRIKTKKELENRYLVLLNKAVSVDEIINIEKEISYLREEIESSEKQLKSLRNKVSYGTLTVVYYELSNQSQADIGKFTQGLINGWNGILWFLIGLTNLWPLIMLSIIALVLIRFFRKRRKKRK